MSTASSTAVAMNPTRTASAACLNILKARFADLGTPEPVRCLSNETATRTHDDDRRRGSQCGGNFAPILFYYKRTYSRESSRLPGFQPRQHPTAASRPVQSLATHRGRANTCNGPHRQEHHSHNARSPTTSTYTRCGHPVDTYMWPRSAFACASPASEARENHSAATGRSRWTPCTPK